MKWLVLLAVVFLALMWIKRAQRARDTRAAPAPGEPVQLVLCEECGLHVPVTDAQPTGGGGGLFAPRNPPPTNRAPAWDREGAARRLRLRGCGRAS